MSTAQKPWFITSASSGFDHAFATHALARGYNVVATARNVAKLQKLVAEAPHRVLALQLDSIARKAPKLPSPPRWHGSDGLMS
jgi:NADP-dependent 3-hydroxy acid dehydrogenase YdfG